MSQRTSANVLRFACILPLAFLVPESKGEDLPPAHKVLARFVEATGGLAAYEKIASRTMQGEIVLASLPGQKGSYTQIQNRDGDFRSTSVLAIVGMIEMGSNNGRAWTNDSIQGPRLPVGREADQLRAIHILYPELKPARIWKSMETVAVENIDGEPAYKLSLSPHIGDSMHAWYAVASGKALKTSYVLFGPGGEIPMESHFKDYRDFGGILIPTLIVQKNPASPELQQTLRIVTVEHSPKPERDRLTPPQAILDLVDRGEGKPPTEIDLPAAALWVKERAIPLASTSPGDDPVDLEPLKKIVGDARIVSLGEPTHGSREVFQLKHRFLTFLVEKMGFSLFAIEANLPEAHALNEYIVDGRGNPRALLRNMGFWTWDTEEVLALIEGMRAWNLERGDRPPIRFAGFDMQNSDLAGKIAADFAAAHFPELADALRQSRKDVMQLRKMETGPSDGFGEISTKFPVDAARGKTVTVSAWIRTENVTGMTGVWWRCDTPEGVRGFNNMQAQRISGTRDWKQYSFEIQVPTNTKAIYWGFLLGGEGTAWFDDVEILLDGVKYEDPSGRSFGFENANDRTFVKSAEGFVAGLVSTSPRSGATCLELRRDEIAPPDPAKTAARARELADALEARSASAEHIPLKDRQWAVRNARVVSQAADMATADYSFDSRDLAMADNVDWLLANHPGERVVLWAHNGHIGRRFRHFYPMGRHLHERHERQVLAFAFLTGTGTYTASPALNTAPTTNNVLSVPPAGSVEDLLSQSQQPLALLDLRTTHHSPPEWLRASLPIRCIGAVAVPMQFEFAPIVVGDAFDVLVWLRETSASKPLKAK